MIEQEFNVPYQDYYYLSRVEVYLASKYIQPPNYSRFIASSNVRKAIAYGIGYEEENLTVMDKNTVLERIAADFKSNVIWKPKKSGKANHHKTYPRTGAFDKYQREIEGA